MKNEGQLNDPDSALRTERRLSASPREIFQAFELPDRLARWWGPAGFTNTFEVFEFKTGGRWVHVMHAPNGANYPNENVFREITPDTRIAIDHVVAPLFRLTITLTPQVAGTRLIWVQEFESAEMASKLRAVCEPANEENLDRLEAVLANTSRQPTAF